MDASFLCAVGMGLAFAGMQVALKQILRPKNYAGMERRMVRDGWMLGDRRKRREATAVPWLFPALVGLLAPFWLVVAWLGWDSGLLVWDGRWEAVRWPLLWAFVMLASGTGFAWLIQRLSLSEVLGYKKGLITLGAALADVFVFETMLPVATVAAIVLLLGGAGLLTGSRGGRPNLVQAAVLVGWCAVAVAQLSLYKQGLMMQPDVLSYAVLAQGLASSLFALLWLRRDVREIALPWRWVAALLAFVLIGNVLEGFAYKAMPLSVVLVVTMLPATVLGAYDIIRGDLRLKWASAAGFAFLAGGFCLLLLAP